MDNSLSKIVGIVPLKKHSRRLPRKNLRKINGIPLYEIACNKLLLSKEIGDVFLLSDIEVDIDGKKYKVMDRPERLSHYLTPLQEVLYWFLYDKQMNDKYDKVVMLIPSAPMIRQVDVDRCVNMIASDIFDIVRTHDKYGRENGLYGFDVKYLSGKRYWYDVYTGSFEALGIEIHTIGELNKARKGLCIDIIPT